MRPRFTGSSARRGYQSATALPWKEVLAPAVLDKHRPQCCKQLDSYAGLIWSTREVNRRATRLLGPTTTCMLRNLQWQFPIGTQPIVKTWRLRRGQFLDDTDVVGSPPCKLAPIATLRPCRPAPRSVILAAIKPEVEFDPGFLEHLRLSPRAVIGPGVYAVQRVTSTSVQNCLIGSHLRRHVCSWPFSAAPIVRLRVRYRRSCCPTGRVVGEAVDDPKRS
jgi:hypothetical protein